MIGVLAILMFNVTMPITLIALANTFYHNKGFAFGLTTFALFIGATPVLLNFKSIFFTPICLFVIVSTTAVIVYLGLKQYENMGVTND